MASIRTILKHNYVQISNKVAQNLLLSYEAKGLLVELLSHDKKWKIHRKQLLRKSCADEKLKRIMDELRNQGYLYLYQGNTTGGFRSVWIVSDTPRTAEQFLDAINIKEVPGFVYLIDDGHQNIKIGMTCNWQQRFSASEFGPETKIILIIQCKNPATLEANLHTRFSSKQVKKEWFRLEESDIESVRQEFQDHLRHPENSTILETRIHNKYSTLANTNVLQREEEINTEQRTSEVPSEGLQPSSEPSEDLDNTQPKKIYDHSSDPYIFAAYLLDMVEKGPRPNTHTKDTGTPKKRELLLQKQAVHFDLLFRRDKVAPVDALKILEWSQKHSFWGRQIQSGEKFRIKYLQLKDIMNDEQGNAPTVKEDPNPDLTKEMLTTFRRLINNPGFKPNSEQANKLIEASAKCERFFRRKDLLRITWADLLLDCLDSNYCNKGETVQVGHMCGDHTWTILMPQYLVQCGLV